MKLQCRLNFHDFMMLVIQIKHDKCIKLKNKIMKFALTVFVLLFVSNVKCFFVCF